MTDDFDAELNRLRTLPDGPAKSDGLAGLVRRADADGRADRRRAARWELLGAGLGSELGHDHVLPTFASLLADHDADPDAAAADGSTPDRLSDAYVRVLRLTTEYPSIPKARIEALLEDFAARSRAWGGDAADALEARLHARGTLGDLEAVPALCRAMTAARQRAGLPRSFDAEALAGIYTAQPERALAAMLPALNDAGGNFRAGIWRTTFLSWVLRPLGWLDRDEEADVYFAEADRRGSGWLFGDILLLEYACRRVVRGAGARTEADAGRLAPRLTRLLREAPGLGPSFRSQAYQVCGLACEVLAELGDRPRRLPLPGDPAGADGDAPIRPPSVAAAALTAAAEALDAAFAARNGNDYLARERAGNRAFVFGPGSGIDRVPADRRARLAAIWAEAEESAGSER